MTDSPEASSPWHTVDESAAYAKRHPMTVYNALQAGELKGHQSKKGAKWLIHIDDLDAWIRGEIAAAGSPARAS